jgi:serine/threonine protein kinase
MEYAAPETLPSPQTGLLKQVDSKADMWSLGMILHKLLFLKLPYQYADVAGAGVGADGTSVDDSEKFEALEREVLDYTGLIFSPPPSGEQVD